MRREIKARETCHADAPVEVVFATLTDHLSYADWSACDEAFLVEEGDPAPNGLGAVRLLRDKTSLPEPIDIEEEINHYWPPYVMGYRITEGGPVADHQGFVVLTERDGGTDIAWQLTANPLDPSTVDLLRAGIEAGVKQLVADLAAESERRAP